MLEYPEGFAPALANKPICGVLAVAVCAKVSYQVANEACRRTMLSHQTRHGGRTYHDQRIAALRTLGAKFIELPLLTNITLKNFVLKQAKRDVVYMVGVTGHVVTVLNNAVMDQAGCWNILLSPNAGENVRKIVEIIA